MMLIEGSFVLDFEFLLSIGEIVKFFDYCGQWVLIYFYFKDMILFCMQQVCDFWDCYEEFKGLNMVILGISMDLMSRYDKFIVKYGLLFILLLDEEYQVVE